MTMRHFLTNFSFWLKCLNSWSWLIKSFSILCELRTSILISIFVPNRRLWTLSNLRYYWNVTDLRRNRFILWTIYDYNFFYLFRVDTFMSHTSTTTNQDKYFNTYVVHYWIFSINACVVSIACFCVTIS